MTGPFARQLSSAGYVLDVRPEPGQQERPAGRGLARAEPVSCVLLLSRSCDAELDAVGRLLGRVGVTVARLNSDELASVDMIIDPGRRAIRLDGAWLAPTLTWNRHFSVQAIPGAGSPARDLFRRESWQAVASQLAVLAEVSIGVRRAGLLEQQSLARRHRITVPRTIVTTDPQRARELLGTRRVVIKAVDQHFVEASPGRLSGVFPVIAGHQESLSAPGARDGPVIVQEYVEHDSELRVYYVDGEVLGFEVRKEAPADLWLAADRVEVRRVDVPGPVESAASLLAADLELCLGAFDFLLRDGIPVFLEVNPHGDWRWAEQKSGTDLVTTAVARTLCRLHASARARRPPARGRRADYLDLIRFLSSGSRHPSP